MAAGGFTSGADFLFEAGNLDAEVLRVHRFSGTEGVSELFRFDLELAGFDHEVNFDDVVGQKAIFTWKMPDGERYVHGIVSRFEQTGRGRALAYYRARLVPRAWLLTRRRSCRIFQNMATPDILLQMLKDGGLPADMVRNALKRNYTPRSYCVQYRESDFDFISRLMEEEGIFYFFEHTEDSHVLVLADDNSVTVPIDGDPTLPYREGEGQEVPEDHVSTYRISRAMRPGSVVIKEFNFKRPALALKAEKRAGVEEQLEVYDYPGRYPDQALGDELVAIRLEEQRAEREAGAGQSSCRRFVSGYRFTLENHFRQDLNVEWTLLRVRHTGSQPQATAEDQSGAQGETVYSNEFECASPTVPYRPPRITPRPRVEGPQTAIVTGPAGEEIHTDEHGRVKVRFPWDRAGVRDDKSSCWVRVSQGWAGAGWGAVFLPRVGQEVIVEFLEGDPDRPIITGRVYNGESPPPYTLPDEKTKSTIKTNSSPDGQGCNELRFEDKKGDEQILIQAEKDMDLYVKNDRREWIRRDQHLIVDRDKVEKIDRDEHGHIDRDQVVEITRDQSLKVGGKQMVEVEQTRSLTVTGDVHEWSKANHSHEVAQNLYFKAMGIVIEGMQELTLKVGGNFVRLDSGGVTIKGTMVKLNSGGSAGTGQAGRAVPARTPLQAAQAASVAAPAAQAGPQDDRPTHTEPGRDEPPPPEKTWIELELVDEADQPVPGEPYEIELPDGKIATGTTGADGVARHEGVEPGTCKIRFPRLDKDAWEKI